MKQSALDTFIVSFAVAIGCYPQQATGHGAYHEELQRIDEQIAGEPANSDLWFRRSYLSFLHGDWGQALNDVEKAERLAPGKHPADLVRGQALMSGGYLKSAGEVLTGFIESRPELAEGYTARARVLLKLGKYDDAVADFANALAKSKNPEPDLYIETAEAMVTQEHPERAVKVLQAGVAKLGAIPSLVSKALVLEVSLGLYDDALSRVAAMQQIAPRPEPWMAKRAQLLTAAGRGAEARAAWIELRDRILALPNLERGSHAMSVLAEQAEKALAATTATSISPAPLTRSLPPAS